LPLQLLPSTPLLLALAAHLSPTAIAETPALLPFFFPLSQSHFYRNRRYRSRQCCYPSSSLARCHHHGRCSSLSPLTAHAAATVVVTTFFSTCTSSVASPLPLATAALFVPYIHLCFPLLPAPINRQQPTLSLSSRTAALTIAAPTETCSTHLSLPPSSFPATTSSPTSATATALPHPRYYRPQSVKTCSSTVATQPPRCRLPQLLPSSYSSSSLCRSYASSPLGRSRSLLYHSRKTLLPLCFPCCSNIDHTTTAFRSSCPCFCLYCHPLPQP
ncbi:hypothetical protein BHE74_00055791, partial [Ensete ventricosum]